MNSALIIGIVLIILGLGLGVGAYMVITSSEEQDDETEGHEQDEYAEAAPSQAEVSEDEDSGEDQLEPTEPEEPGVSATVEPALMGADTPEEQAEAVEEPSEPEPSPAAVEVPDEHERIQVATLLRDDVTGDLIIRVGDREYTSPDDLRTSSDWTRVEYAASDLAEWVQPPARQPDTEQDVSVDEDEQASDRKPSTMIEQINSILQEMIEASGKSELAVRLIEGPGGMARVLIGVHSYEIAEVPDPEVQELIRKAVASWESSQ